MTRRRDVVLGLDVGTTAVKVVAHALDDGATLTTVVQEHRHDLPVGQQDPHVVLRAVTAAMAECVGRLTAGGERSPGPTRVAAVGLSTAMHALLGLDRDHRPLGTVSTWADPRARRAVRELRALPQASRLHATTGTPLHPMSPLAKLYRLRREDPELLAGACWWVGLKELVHLHLTGVLATDASSASATGWHTLGTGVASAPALDLGGLRMDQLALVLETTSSHGLRADLARVVGLVPGTPVVVGGADGPLATLGTGATDPGTLSLSLGTSGAVRAVVASPPERLDPALFCYLMTEDRWVVGGAVSNGGNVVRWAAQTLVPDLLGPSGRDQALLDIAATVPAGSDGLVMLPYLLPERSPSWDADLTGVIAGLQPHHGRPHMVRAAIEGVALQLSTISGRLARIEPTERIVATGGALQSPLWRDVLAAVLGLPLTVGRDAGGSATGAAILAAHSVGAGSLADLAVQMAPSTQAEVVRPNPALVAAYRQWREEVRHVLEGVRSAADAL